MNVIINKSTKRIAGALATMLLVAGLAGCQDKTTGAAKENESANADTQTVKAVASTTQVCDYITQLATDNSKDAQLSFNRMGSDGKKEHFGAEGDNAKSTLDLTCLLAPNASAHEHEMTPEQSKALADADLFFVSGVDLEHFLDQAVQSTGFKGTMVITAGVAGAADVDDLKGQQEKESKLPYKVDRGIDKVDVAKWPFPPEEGESEPEFRFDPHVWTSPHNAMVQVKNIGHALEVASPKNKDLFKKHVDKYLERLQELDEWAKESLDSVPEKQRVLFTSHDAFGYFSNEFNVKFEGAALSDFNSQQDATADKIKETAKQVKDAGAVAIFAENSNNPKSVQKVAEVAGVKAVIGDEALYGDSLGEPGSDGETYIGSILHNVTNLVTAWDGKVAQVPDRLSQWAPKK
ncbi:metal ABC transporter substrate-binding protein [Gleimia hominis]|uniref:Metal ABC transporter substrate-binding protein n=1 Tax=Gleimia hominis TaxID=595468 RepID=A0ABU3ICC0_9ACTO|nr:metal ABC transporter substrate-binding protein [Gleimia hominis]MDT3768029.1 metal ABC transporter substrate-binding protein [Gleimia hominis]